MAEINYAQEVKNKSVDVQQKQSKLDVANNRLSASESNLKNAQERKKLADKAKADAIAEYNLIPDNNPALAQTKAKALEKVNKAKKDATAADNAVAEATNDVNEKSAAVREAESNLNASKTNYVNAQTAYNEHEKSSLSNTSVDYLTWAGESPQDPVSANDIEYFTQERLAYLYNLEPTQDNMFICSIIAPTHIGAYGTADPSNTNWHARKLYCAPYRLYSADFHLPKISFERDNRLRRHFPKSVEMNSEFTLSWIEDCFHSIRKYHHDWFNCWYQREHDGWAIDDGTAGGKNGRFRSFRIFMYHMTPQTKNGEVVVTPGVWGYIDIRGCMPCGLGDIKLGPDSGNSIYSCTYIADYIDLRFCNSSGKSSDGKSDATSDSSKDILFTNNIESLKLMGLNGNEINRLQSQFGLRNSNGGESFLS